MSGSKKNANDNGNVSTLFGILAGCLFLFGILNVIVIKPAVNNAIEKGVTPKIRPISDKLEQIDSSLTILAKTVTDHIEGDQKRLNNSIIDDIPTKKSSITTNEEPTHTD